MWISRWSGVPSWERSIKIIGFHGSGALIEILRVSIRVVVSLECNRRLMNFLLFTSCDLSPYRSPSWIEFLTLMLAVTPAEFYRLAAAAAARFSPHFESHCLMRRPEGPVNFFSFCTLMFSASYTQTLKRVMFMKKKMPCSISL